MGFDCDNEQTECVNERELLLLVFSWVVAEDEDAEQDIHGEPETHATFGDPCFAALQLCLQLALGERSLKVGGRQHSGLRVGERSGLKVGERRQSQFRVLFSMSGGRAPSSTERPFANGGGLFTDNDHL